MISKNDYNTHPFMLQPIAFVSFDTRKQAEKALEELQV